MNYFSRSLLLPQMMDIALSFLFSRKRLIHPSMLESVEVSAWRKVYLKHRRLVHSKLHLWGRWALDSWTSLDPQCPRAGIDRHFPCIWYLCSRNPLRWLAMLLVGYIEEVIESIVGKFFDKAGLAYPTVSQEDYLVGFLWDLGTLRRGHRYIWILCSISQQSS